LSLHDALPIYKLSELQLPRRIALSTGRVAGRTGAARRGRRIFHQAGARLLEERIRQKRQRVSGEARKTGSRTGERKPGARTTELRRQVRIDYGPERFGDIGRRGLAEQEGARERGREAYREAFRGQ